MTNKNIKKYLSAFLVAVYLMIYTAPVGFCISAIARMDSSKPALRNSAQVNPSKITPLKLEGDISISKGNPKVSLSLRDSDVKQVLRMFADKAGLNIIFHGSVSGKVTLDLVNVPLNDAFKMIMQTTDLTYYIDYNTMVVTSASAAKTLNLAKQEMITIPVKYVDATILADFLNKNIFSLNKPGLSNSQIAITNPGTNEILIFGTNNDYLIAKKVIEQFDKKPLEQTFVVNHTTPKEMSDLICTTLFKKFSSTSSGGSSGGESSSGGSSSNGDSNGGNSNGGNSPNAGGGTPPSSPPSSPMTPLNSLPGAPTGGAADAGDSGGGNSTTSMSLGAGVIACQYNNSVTAGNLSSLNTNNLAITYFSQRGTIQVLGGSLQQMEMIKDFIFRNDKKQPQAYLEVSIIELNENGSRQFNNTWNIISEGFSGTFDGTISTNPLYPQFIRGDSLWLTDGKMPPKNVYEFQKVTGTPIITYTMSYLIKNGKGRVLANPKILITNGQTSTIDLSSDYVKTVTSQVMTSNGQAGATQRTYNIASDEGIKVSLMPFISPEGYVTLNIKPEYSTEKGQVTEHNAATGTDDVVATLLQRRNLDLKNIRIKDGETLVIGGMIRDSETKNVSKIPVLGDLPGIGMFFRNTDSTKVKEELVIMITPKIIKDSEDLVNSNSGTAL